MDHPEASRSLIGEFASIVRKPIGALALTAALALSTAAPVEARPTAAPTVHTTEQSKAAPSTQENLGGIGEGLLIGGIFVLAIIGAVEIGHRIEGS